jgi:hypothetical protein
LCTGSGRPEHRRIVAGLVEYPQSRGQVASDLQRKTREPARRKRENSVFGKSLGKRRAGRALISPYSRDCARHLLGSPRRKPCRGGVIDAHKDAISGPRRVDHVTRTKPGPSGAKSSVAPLCDRTGTSLTRIGATAPDHRQTHVLLDLRRINQIALHDVSLRLDLAYTFSPRARRPINASAAAACAFAIGVANESSLASARWRGGRSAPSVVRQHIEPIGEIGAAVLARIKRDR